MHASQVDGAHGRARDLIAPGLEIDSAAEMARDPNLQMRDLRQSRVSDFAAVANLKSLEYFNLSGTPRISARLLAYADFATSS